MAGEGLQTVERIDEALCAELLDCWVDVSNAGGAVGFVPPVSADDVAPKLDHAVAEANLGRRTFVIAKSDDQLIAFGVLKWNDSQLFSHWATIAPLMVHPKAQGRGLGRVLLDGVTDVARHRGLEYVTLDYREGLGLGEFYAKAGFVEVGRTPGRVRVAPGDDRDSVYMVRRLR